MGNNTVAISKPQLKKLATFIREGGIAIYPTDTAYAIGCRFDNPLTITRIMELKGRQDRRFTVIASSLEQVESNFDMNDHQLQLAKEYWPGPLSIVVSEQFAVRVPELEVARDIAEEVGVPLIATSFNISGNAPMFSLDGGYADDTLDFMNIEHDGMVNIGPLEETDPSTVVECIDNKLVIHRQGSIEPELPLPKNGSSIRIEDRTRKAGGGVFQAPSTPADIKSVLKHFKLSANKHLGQHFLVDATVLDRMIDEYRRSRDAINRVSTAANTILEVGPGLGVLTQRLLEESDQVISVERDKQLEPILNTMKDQNENLQVVFDDIFNVNLNDLGLTSGNYSIIANLPYQITSLFLRNFLTLEPWPDQMIILIQKEVAERIVAEPRKLSILGLSVQLFCEPELLFTVPREAFYPEPGVTSAVISLRNIRKNTLINRDREDDLFKLIKAGFSQKRKKLLTNLTSLEINGQSIEKKDWNTIFGQLQLSDNVRAQELSVNQWISMLDNLESFVI